MWNRLNEIVLKSLEIIIYWRKCNLLLAYSHGFSFLEFKKLSSPYQTWEFKAFHRIKMSNNSLTQVFSQSFRSSWALFLYYVGGAWQRKMLSHPLCTTLMVLSSDVKRFQRGALLGDTEFLTNNDDDAAASFLQMHRSHHTFCGYFYFKTSGYFYI